MSPPPLADSELIVFLKTFGSVVFVSGPKSGVQEELFLNIGLLHITAHIILRVYFIDYSLAGIDEEHFHKLDNTNTLLTSL